MHAILAFVGQSQLYPYTRDARKPPPCLQGRAQAIPFPPLSVILPLYPGGIIRRNGCPNGDLNRRAWWDGVWTQLGNYFNFAPHLVVHKSTVNGIENLAIKRPPAQAINGHIYSMCVLPALRKKAEGLRKGRAEDPINRYTLC